MKTRFIKLFNFKPFFLLGLVALLSPALHAQTPDSVSVPDQSAEGEYVSMFDPSMLTPECTLPLVKTNAVIKYETFTAGYVEFDNLGPGNATLSLINTSQTAVPVTVTPVANKVILNNLQPGQVYILQGKNSCNEVTTLAVINTVPYVPGDPITASDNLYKALSAYVATGTQTQSLEDYVQSLTNVDQYEKSAFAQRYFLDGATLPSTYFGTYPSQYVKDGLQWRNQNRGGKDCICNFILLQSAIAIPDNSVGDFEIAQSVSNGSGSFNSNSKWWYTSAAEGPGKYHQLWSDGFKAGSNNYTKELSYTANNLQDNKSPFFARLGYHLLCVNFPDRLPENCGCTKQVRVNFGYDTEVSARAVVLGGIFEKRSSAVAQDWAVAFATHDKESSFADIQILDAGLATAEAKCSGGYPITLITDALGIVYSVAQVVGQVKTSGLQGASGGIQDLITKISNVLQTLFKEHDCSTATQVGALLQGSTTINFQPNDPISIVVMSGSKLTVKGKRSWQSHGRVLSSFHLAGVLMGGNPGPESMHCCTDYTGNWAYSSYLGDKPSRQIQINQHLHQNGPGIWQTINGASNPSGQPNAFTELGFSIGKLLEGNACNVNIPIFPGLR